MAQSLGQYLRAWLQRIRSGDSGVLPVLLGLVIVAVAFQIANGKFLSPQNLVNLIEQSTHLHAPGDGGDLRAAARRDRSVGRPRDGVGGGARRRGNPAGRPRLAVVAGDHRLAAHLLGCRTDPGHAGRPPQDAVVHRHPRRVVDPRRGVHHRPRRQPRRYRQPPFQRRGLRLPPLSGGSSARWSAGSCSSSSGSWRPAGSGTGTAGAAAPVSLRRPRA